MSLSSDSDNLPSEDKVLYSNELGPKPQEKKKIIIISDSEDELPDVNTVLSRISVIKKQFLTSTKITKPRECFDNYVFVNHKQEFLLRKDEIETKLQTLKTRLRQTDFVNKINQLAKTFHKSYFFNEFKQRKICERKDISRLQKRVCDFNPGYYGYIGYEIIYKYILKFGINTIVFNGDKCDLINEVLIPEIGVYLIMEDLNVDYNLGIKIRKHSAKYGSIHFVKKEDKTYGSIEFDTFMETYSHEIPIIID